MYILYLCMCWRLYFQGYTPVMEATPPQLTPQLTPAHMRAENQEAQRQAAETSSFHNSATEVGLHCSCEYLYVTDFFFLTYGFIPS